MDKFVKLIKEYLKNMNYFN